MSHFLVSYDLIEHKNYDRIITELKRLKACKMLLSSWLLDANNTAKEIKNHFAKFVDDDDRLVVIEFSIKPEYTRAFQPTNEWIAARY